MGTQRRGKVPRSDRPSWPDEHLTEEAVLPSFWPERMTQAVVAEASLPPPWAGLAESDGEPLWERWYERAIEEGVDEELAWLGRTVIREARAQRWDDDLRGECGWYDEGEAMLELALLAPERAAARWRALLED